ncbi:MAG: aminotransferase class I/II-fold pyridoxal phosphate-dependent enzyme [Treponema sp.]|nr:aminotransferase class I/II-fold pyridoxal phosphate-dependent enzyme [Treponema sp.]
MAEELLAFSSDYMEGAHPNILTRLNETNMLHTAGYGSDEFSESARNLIRKACACPKAQVQFLIGGTQTNAFAIDCLLKNWQGVIAADTGHVAVHEAGAIEYTGHKVLPIKSQNGKITAQGLEKYISDFYDDANWEHMVEPGMVYISQPSELGTLYSLKELSDISKICRKRKIPLYLDGARLAYALGSKENDLSLKDLAKLTDVFYIGGTKCGTLFGEALVIPNPDFIPHLITQIKQHGALLAKGRITGIQFEELFKSDLYFQLGKEAVSYADKIRQALIQAGYKLYFENPTNQVFFIIPNEKLKALGKKVMYGFWEKYDENHTVIRFATSWATKKEDLDSLIEVIKTI